MFFASDNWAGAAPEIVEAVAREAARYGTAYGESEIDRAVERKFAEIFEREVAVFFVATGSAANALALASVNKPGGVIFCHSDSHIMVDECGGVEFLTGGARLAGVEGHAGRLDPQRVAAAIARFEPGFVHSGQPMAVSITQMSEAGTVYGIDQIRAISAIARERGLPLHMDGARFANALSHLVVSPAEMTWKAGVDVLSFGGTKNGCIGAEALVIFDPAKAAEAPYLRKRAGQLFSKSRFIAAQFDAYFRDGLWCGLPATRTPWPAGSRRTRGLRPRSRSLAYARQRGVRRATPARCRAPAGQGRRLPRLGRAARRGPRACGRRDARALRYVIRDDPGRDRQLPRGAAG